MTEKIKKTLGEIIEIIKQTSITEQTLFEIAKLNAEDLMENGTEFPKINESQEEIENLLTWYLEQLKTRPYDIQMTVIDKKLVPQWAIEGYCLGALKLEEDEPGCADNSVIFNLAVWYIKKLKENM